MQTKTNNMLTTLKKHIKFALLAFIFFVLFSGNCIGQSITWQRTYDGPAHFNDRGYSISQAGGSNFYVVGRTIISGYYHYILKLNEFGDTLWTRSIQLNPGFGEFSLSSVSDGSGGVIVTGFNDTSFTMRLNNNGNIIWYKNYNTIAATCYSIIKKNDGGYISCGFKLSSDYYGYVLNIDSSGNLIWQRQYPSTELRIYEDIIEHNNGFYLVGEVTDAVVDTQQVLLTKINYAGDVQWEKRYLVSGRDGNGYRIQRNNNNIIIAGSTTDSLLPGGRGYFILTDTSGNLIFTKVFQSTKGEGLKDLIVLNDNTLLVTLTRDSSFNISTSRVIITDLNGNIIREKYFIPPQHEGNIDLYSSMKANNGDLIFTGSSYLDTNTTSEDVFVARTDSLLYAPPLGIKNNQLQIPKIFEISEPYPNPFNPNTKIVYKLHKQSNLTISIFDVNGKLVRTLINGLKKAGTYALNIDLQRDKISSGIYFISLFIDNDLHITKKLVFVK